LVSLVKRKKMHVELVQGFLLMEPGAKACRNLQPEYTNTMHWFCMVFFLKSLAAVLVLCGKRYFLT